MIGKANGTRVGLACCLALALGCYPDPAARPAWIEALLPRLRCGMNLDEIRALSEREVKDLGSGHWFFGSHRIETHGHELWLLFDGAGLRAVSWAAAVDTKHSRHSPRHDLCTGELSFLVDVSWTYDLVGSTVFLDDVMIAQSTELCPPLELSTASHVLRIDTPDGASIVYPLDLTPDDPGFLLLYVSLEEVCLYPPITRPIDRRARCRPA